jgi:hypothetical protein
MCKIIAGAALAVMLFSAAAQANQYDDIYLEQANAEIENATKEAISETALAMFAEHCRVITEKQLFRVIDSASGDLLHFWRGRRSYAAWHGLPLLPMPKYVNKELLWSAGLDMYGDIKNRDDCAFFSREHQIVYELLQRAGPRRLVPWKQ